MKSAITVSLVPEAKGGPFVFWEGLDDACSTAAKLGFDAIEIFPRSADDVSVAKVVPIVKKYGLRVAAVGTGGGWVAHKWTLTHADAAVREKARVFIAGIIDAAAALDAPAIIGSMQGKAEGDVTRDQALGWLGAALEELGARSASNGQPLFYEPLNRYETNLLNRQSDAASFIGSFRTDGVRLLADMFHMNIEEADIAASVRDAGRFIGHVHFADSNRRAIGLGHTSVAPVIAALREIGYAGYLSAEVLPLPDSATAARVTMESFRSARSQT